jgi:GTP pyrophosphokinase
MRWINAREKERSYTLGREMCEKTFKKRNQNFNALIKSGEIKKVAESYGFKTIDDLIAQVGLVNPPSGFKKARILRNKS